MSLDLLPLVRRFGGQELALRRELIRNDDLRALWSDFEAAVEALRYWETHGSETGIRAEEYRRVVREFEDAIRETLAGD